MHYVYWNIYYPAVTTKSLCYPGNSSNCIIRSSSSCNNSSKWNPCKCWSNRIHVQISRWVTDFLEKNKKWAQIVPKWPILARNYPKIKVQLRRFRPHTGHFQESVGYFCQSHFSMNTILFLESVDLYNGIIFALILFFLEILRAIFYSLFFAISYRLGMRLRSGLVTLVMQKGNYSKLPDRRKITRSSRLRAQMYDLNFWIVQSHEMQGW